MPRIEIQTRKKNIVKYPTYSAKDFFVLQKELSEYEVEKDLPLLKGGFEKVKFVPVEGIQKWLIKQGALSNREEWIIKDISLYRELQDKLEQYASWCRRREYAQNKSLEKYADIAAETVVISDDIPF